MYTYQARRKAEEQRILKEEEEQHARKKRDIIQKGANATAAATTNGPNEGVARNQDPQWSKWWDTNMSQLPQAQVRLFQETIIIQTNPNSFDPILIERVYAYIHVYYTHVYTHLWVFIGDDDQQALCTSPHIPCIHAYMHTGMQT